MPIICSRHNIIISFLIKVMTAAILLLILTGSMSTALGCSACVGAGADVYVRTYLLVEEDHLTRLDVQWQLPDNLYKMFLEHDQNQDDHLVTAEKQKMAAFFYDDLRSFDYFLELAINGQKMNNLEFDNQKLNWRDAHSEFNFSLALDQPISDGLHLKMRFIDPDRFMKFYYVQDSVNWNSPAGYQISDNAHLFPQALKISIEH